MNLLLIMYSINCTLLLIHEIESGFEKEWEILKLPGGIAGFLAYHIPLILIMFYGISEIQNGSRIGYIIGIILGLSGTIPFVLHRILVKRKENFHRISSILIMLFNIVFGLLTMLLCITKL